MPLSLLLALALTSAPAAQDLITLEVRAFEGSEDVTDASRIIVHRAGQRDQPVGQISTAAGKRTLKVAPGIYDAQAIHEQAGKVVSIRWAERLVVMRYPDEAGHHLEVINYQTGYGALEVRGGNGQRSDAELALFTRTDRERPAATPLSGGPYTLFVVRAGEYELHAKRGTRSASPTRIDVPLDRTRLWIVP